MSTLKQHIKTKIKSFKGFLRAMAWQEEEKPLHSAKPLNLEQMGLYPLHEYFQYDSYDPETHIYQGKNAKGILIEAIPMSGASDNHMEAIYTLLQRTLPEGTILHCVLYASPQLGEVLDDYVKARKNYHPVTVKLAQKRAAFWKKGVFHSLIPWQPMVLRDFQLLIGLVFDHELALSDATIFTLKEQLKGVLKSVSITYQMVEPPRLLQWLNALLRPDENLYPADSYYNEMTSLSTLIAAPHRQKRVFSDHILIDDGEWQIRNFRVADFGKEGPHLCQISDLIGHLFESNAQIGCPFSLSMVVKICRASEENGRANRLAFRALQRAEVIGKFSPKAIRDAEDARAIVSEIEKAERLTWVSFQISLYCQSIEANNHESSLMNVVQASAFKWRILKNFMVQPIMLLAHLPLGPHFGLLKDLEHLGLLYKLWAKNAAGMLPLVAEPKGMNTHHLMLAGRRGQVFFFDPFGNQRGNYNTCVAGIAGSGKSVVVQEIANSLVGTGGRVFIIDIGRSYKRLCSRLSGQFIEFTAENPLCLNPFSTVKSEELMEFYDFMVNFVAVMIQPQQGLSLIERSYVEKAVKKTWETQGTEGSISTVADILLTHEDVRAKDLGTALYPYTTEGQYGHFFNGPASVDFNNPCVVFELEEISGNKLLQSIVFALLMYHVTEKMYLGDRKTKITLIIDEAWTMLKGGQGGAIIENIARKARKYQGALITITQSVMDYFLSEASQAAFTNSYWKIILMQNQGDIETLVEQRKLPLNPYQKRLLCSVKTEQGVYSEMMILGDAGECAVGRLFLDPYSRVLYSTQAADFAAVNELLTQGFALEEAIEVVAKRNFPHDV